VATTITAYEAIDGSIHRNACDAAGRDLGIMLENAGLNLNSGHFREVASWLKGKPGEIAAALTAYAAACPKQPEQTAPLAPLEGTRDFTLDTAYQGHAFNCRARALADLTKCNCGKADEDRRDRPQPAELHGDCA